MSDDIRARLAAVSALAKAGDLKPMRTEYGWACPKSTDEKPCLHDGRSEAYVRFIVQKAGGAVYVREVTDWRAES